ncbi:MAG TPA: hypothetical protein VK524_22250 [Polyangiaceae bacterium]|nr:hypothetical protein [Polyangiaceae bacterium]
MSATKIEVTYYAGNGEWVRTVVTVRAGETDEQATRRAVGSYVAKHYGEQVHCTRLAS